MKVNQSQSEALAASQAQPSRTADLISLGKAVDSAATPGAVSEVDSVSLSGVAAGIEAAIRGQALERQNRVEELQRQVAAGTYHVEAKELGQSLVRDMLSGSEPY